MQPDDVWQEIIENYKKAQHCLCCPKHENNWCRDEENGFAYLWKAYHDASSAKEKNHLWYARILFMMYEQFRFPRSEYDLFHNYLEPAFYEYELAKDLDKKPTDAELEQVRQYYDVAAYMLDNTKDTADGYERSISLIKGELPEGFRFHDSKPVHFTLKDDSAFLELCFCDTCVTLKFIEVNDLQVNYDPETDYVFDFYCYPVKYNPKLKVFDVGIYQIICKEVEVIPQV